MNKLFTTATLSLLSVSFSALTLAPKVQAITSISVSSISTYSTTVSNQSKLNQNVVKSDKPQQLADAAVSCYDDDNNHICCYVDDDGNYYCEAVTVN